MRRPNGSFGMIASLAMYPFASLQPHYKQLWTAVHARLGYGPTHLDWNRSHLEACTQSDLLLGQTCGWPLVTTFAQQLRVVGVFDLDLPSASYGTYRSVLIARRGDRARSRYAINGMESLSGCISLRAAVGDISEAVHTGSHLASCQAVADGLADLASIDAMSWVVIGAENPHVADALECVGHGPRVPCLPLVTAMAEAVEPLRLALRQVTTDPQMVSTCRLLRIRGFFDRTIDDYLPLLDLA